MSVAVGAEFFQFQTPGSIATIFGGRITRNSARSLVLIARATFGTF